MPLENCHATSPGPFRVIGAQVLFRHGARTPIYEFPDARGLLREIDWDAPDMCSPIPESQIPISVCSLDGTPLEKNQFSLEAHLETRTPSEVACRMRAGKLTRRGQQGFLRLGEQLRQRYMIDFGLISSSYDEKEIHCRSTLFDRTIGSMRSFFSGLFPDLRNSGTPVKICASTPQEEILLGNRFKCKILSPVKKDCVVRSPASISKLRRQIYDVLGTEALSAWIPQEQIRQEFPVVFVYDNLIARKYEGETFPADYEAILEELIKLTPLEHKHITLGPERCWTSLTLRAAVGPLCHLLLANLRAHTTRSAPRLVLLCAHDESLIFLLSALRLFDGRWPQFGASLTLEALEAEDGSAWARLLYEGRILKQSTMEEMERLLESAATTEEEYEKLCALGKESLL